jgi:O-antigen ligase
LSDTVLQLLAVPLLLVSFWQVAHASLSKQAQWAVLFCLAIGALPLLQLVPLPPALWLALPNREAIAADFHLLVHAPAWMPISVSPHATWLSALSFLVPLAIFVATVQLDYLQRRVLSLIVLTVGVLSVFVGLTQVSQGPDSGFNFFDSGNANEAVGFFVNRNHFAALLYTLILFAAAWATHAALAGGADPKRKKHGTPAILALVVSFTMLVALVAAEAMARSRAGLALTIVALLGALALAFADRRSTAAVTPTKLLLAATALAVIFASQFALYRIMERFTVDPLQDARIAFAATTIAAAKDFMPFGSGVGTFVPVYALFEKSQDLMANTYANRAHNDLLELWLETGVFGLVMMGIFLVWFAAASWRIWRRPHPGAKEIDLSLARAGTIIIALLMAHSFVDYPLRTGALMGVFAFACGLLIEPAPCRGAAVAADKPESDERAWAFRPSPQTMYADVSEGVATPTKSLERWGSDIEWPEAWRGPSQPHRDKDDDGR